MDEITIKSNTRTQQQDQLASEQTAKAHKRKIVVTAVIVIVLIAVIAGLAFYFLGKKSGVNTMSAEDTLQALSDSSEPPATTEADRGTWLETTKPAAQADQEAQLNALNALHQ